MKPNQRNTYFGKMNTLLFVAEFMWLPMICKVLSDPMKCVIKDGNKKLDCAYIPGSPRTVQKIIEPWLPTKVSKSAVQTLDISGNIYVSADCNDLTNLVQFIAKNLSFDGANPVNNFKTCLTKLKLLEELDLSNTKGLGSNFSGVAWPKKLIKLTLVNMSLTGVVGLDKLDLLQELDLSSNYLTMFPKLNRTAPILLIHLRDNDISNITIEDIASYCEMSSFSVPRTINQPENYQYCGPLQEWVRKYSIDTFESLACKPPGNVAKNFNFSDEATKARTACLNALPGTGIWDILFFAVFFSILFPLLYYGNEAYNNYKAQKLEATAAPVKRRRRKIAVETPQGSDYEGSQTEVDSYDADRPES